MAKIAFQITSDKPDDVSQRGWRTALIAGWFAVGEYHDRVVQPRKFAADAASRYGYQPRSPRYMRRKQRLAKASWRVKEGGERDIVYSGVTRTAVLNRQYPRAFPTKVWVDLPTPSYVSMRPNTRKRRMPALGQELVSVTAEEKGEMETEFEAAVEARLNQLRERKRRRV
jgi:hypothetical protein